MVVILKGTKLLPVAIGSGLPSSGDMAGPAGMESCVNVLGRVLVIGDDTRSFLAIVRSLGRMGCQVEAAPFVFSSAALKSRYVEAVRQMPVYDLEPDAWVDDMASLLKAGRYDLVVPCDDRSILPLSIHRDRFAGTRLALPNPKALDVFYDKYETRQLAKSCDVPVAPGRLLSSEDDAQGLIGEFGLPLVIKPRRSYTLDQTSVRAKVMYCRSDEDVRRAISGTRRDVGAFLVEGSVGHHGVGLSVLCHNGRVCQMFEHHRVNEPRGGGGSSYRVSAAVNPVLAAYVESLARESALDGVAMFEFRANADNTDWYLLEVNARFWGSLPLAINAGVDFPRLLYRQMVQGETIHHAPYRVGFYGRDVIADTFTIGAETLARMRTSKVDGMTYLLGNMLAACRVLIGREAHDVFSWADLRPAMAEYGQIASMVGNRLFGDAALSRSLRVRKAERTVSAAMQAKPAGRPARVLFVCRGNICRSPFAEHYLRGKLKGADGIAVASSGTMTNVGRSCPDDALAAAQVAGFDLSAHRSTHITATAKDPVDLVFVFDGRNLEDVRSIGVVGAETPIVALGDLLPGPGRARPIDDPYGQGREAFGRTYDTIAAAIDRFCDLALPRVS